MRTSAAVYLEGATDSTLRPAWETSRPAVHAARWTDVRWAKWGRCAKHRICREAVMAGVLTVGLVVLLFFATGAVVGATLLIAWSWWRVIRCSTRPWLGSASSRKRER